MLFDRPEPTGEIAQDEGAAAEPVAPPRDFEPVWGRADAGEPPAAPPTQPSVAETELTVLGDEGGSEPPAPDNVSASAQAEQPTAQPEEQAPAAAEETESEPDSDQADSGDGTPRPRRTGWWQRARASIVGN